MKFISTGKTPFVLDTIAHSLEKRKSGETKIVTLTLRTEPLNAKLASAIDQQIRATLFKLNSPEDPTPYLRVAEFTLPVPRQVLHCFASPDTEKASIALDQVKISGIRARAEKGVNAYGLVVKVSFGPASKNELEYVEAWRTETRFLSWEPSEPNLDFEEGEPDDDAEQDTASRPAPMFEDPRDAPQPQSVGAAAAKPAKERTQRKNISHTRGKKKR